MTPFQGRFARLFVAACLALVFTSCGGGGGSGTQAPVNNTTTSSGPTTGVVAILMKDDPSDDFDQILLTITRAELLGGGDPVVVFEGSRRFDLLALQHFYDMLAVSGEVPFGTYSKIRLTLSDITLVMEDDDGNVEIHPALPANGKLDLNPRSPFTVAPDVAILIGIDVDAKSIHIQETGSGKYQFRPVVFVEISERQLNGGLVRIHGTIGEIVQERSFFELCETDVFVDSDRDGCITVNVFGDEVSIFDANGDAVEFSELQTGNEATVLGIAVVSTDGTGDDSDSDSDSDGDSDSDSDQRGDIRIVQIDAIIIELGPEGTFEQLDGLVLTEVDQQSGFEFEIGPGQGFTAGATVTVLVQDATKIVSDQFLSLDTDAIQPGALASIEGVLELSNDVADVLKAALIIIREEGEDLERLVGLILEVSESAPTFQLAAPGGDRCIETDAQSRFFLIRTDDEGMETVQIDFADLEPGLEATVFGESDLDGCFNGAIVITAEPAEV